MRRMLALVTLVVGAGFAWLYQDELTRLLGRSEPGTPVASEELADHAQRKLDRLAAGDEQQIGLAQEEVQSLLLYRYAGLLPGFIDSARVSIRDSRIHVHARVPVHELPRVNELGEATAFLPDTTEIEVVGQVARLDAGRVAFKVMDVNAAGIALPNRLVPGALRRIGREDEPGLPADAVALPLPPGASSAYVSGDSLFFVRGVGQRSGS